MTELVDFIRKNGPDALKEPPYNFLVRPDQINDKQLITVNYHQVKTKDNGKDIIVRQARGIIVDITDLGNPKLVCLPFLRFYNLGAFHADILDHSSIKIQKKHDGSLIKLYYYEDEWRPATRNLAITIGDHALHWENAIEHAKTNYDFSYDKLDKTKVYLFELVGPTNRIIVKYDDTKLYHIGTRCMITLEEQDIDIGIPKPEVYALDNLSNLSPKELDQKMKEMVNDFEGVKEEGLVLCDEKYRRVKVKSPSYLLLHHARGMDPSILCMKTVLMGEQDEIGAVFENLVDQLEVYTKKFRVLVDIWCDNHEMLVNGKPRPKTKKELVWKINRDKDRFFMVSYHYEKYDGKIDSIEDILRGYVTSNKKMIDLMKQMDKIAK